MAECAQPVAAPPPGGRRLPRWPLSFVPPSHLRIPTWSYDDEDGDEAPSTPQEAPAGGAARWGGLRAGPAGDLTDGTAFVPCRRLPGNAVDTSTQGRVTHDGARQPGSHGGVLRPRQPGLSGSALRRVQTRYQVAEHCLDSRGQLPHTWAVESVSGTSSLCAAAAAAAGAAAAQAGVARPSASGAPPSQPAPPPQLRPLSPAALHPVLSLSHRARSPKRAGLSRFAPKRADAVPQDSSASDATGSPRSPLPTASRRRSQAGEPGPAVDALHAVERQADCQRGHGSRCSVDDAARRHGEDAADQVRRRLRLAAGGGGDAASGGDESDSECSQHSSRYGGASSSWASLHSGHPGGGISVTGGGVLRPRGRVGSHGSLASSGGSRSGSPVAAAGRTSLDRLPTILASPPAGMPCGTPTHTELDSAHCDSMPQAAGAHAGSLPLSPTTPFVALGYGVTPGGRRTALAADIVPRALLQDDTWLAGDAASYNPRRAGGGRAPRVCGMLPPTCGVVRSPDGGALARMEHAAQEYVTSWLNTIVHAVSTAGASTTLEASPDALRRAA